MRTVPFDSRLIAHGDKKVVAQIAHCAHKGCKSEVEIINPKGSRIMPPSMFNRKITQRDWAIVGHEAYCPKHKPSSPGRRRVAHSVDANVVFANFDKPAVVPAVTPAPAPTPAPIVPPKESEPMTATIRDLSQLGEATTVIMDPSTRRRVFRLIDEHWDESRGRYENTWSDQRLATDLKVPRAWVEEIRREAFGDNGGNAEMDELKVDLEAAEKRFSEMSAEAARRLDAAVNACAGLEKALIDIKEMRRRLERLEVAILPRR